MQLSLSWHSSSVVQQPGIGECTHRLIPVLQLSAVHWFASLHMSLLTQQSKIGSCLHVCVVKSQ